MKKLVILFVSCIFLMGCPPSSTIEYKPVVSLNHTGLKYLYPIENDSIMIRCFFIRSFVSKPKENLIIIAESKNRNIHDYKMSVQSKKNGNFKIRENGNKLIFHINDSISHKKIDIKNDTVSIIFNEEHKVLFFNQN